MTRVFRDGRTETWHAAGVTSGRRGPDCATRLVVATVGPGTLLDKATWYLATSLPRPARGRQPAPPEPRPPSAS